MVSPVLPVVDGVPIPNSELPIQVMTAPSVCGKFVHVVALVAFLLPRTSQNCPSMPDGVAQELRARAPSSLYKWVAARRSLATNIPQDRLEASSDAIASGETTTGRPTFVYCGSTSSFLNIAERVSAPGQD